jgi:uncharacterized protein YqjF (DUF2071 family)
MKDWSMRQTWHDLCFLHWTIDYQTIRDLVPAALEIDQYEGKAWISIVLFRLDEVRFRGIPELSFMSNFAELNVRTYVIKDGRPGIYFLSLDASKAAVIWGARWKYHLPFYKADVRLHEQRQVFQFTNQRKICYLGGTSSRRFVGKYEPEPNRALLLNDPLSQWLTDRFRFYAVDRAHRLYRCDIEHPPWALQPVKAEIYQNHMLEGYGISEALAPCCLHYAKRMDTFFGKIVKEVG